MKRVISVLAVVIVLAISIIPAFAVPSEEPPKPGYVITVDPTDNGDVTYVPTSEVKEDGTQSFHFTAVPKDGYTFDGWVIDGKYTTTDDLKKAEIDIVISGPIKVTPSFVKKGAADNGKTDVNTDKSSTSPKTGSSDVVAVSLVALSALVIASAVVVAKKSK